MPSPLKGEWTLKMLLTNTAIHMSNRYDFEDRDVLTGVSIREVKEYKLNSTKVRTKYVIESYSYPQYGKYLPPPTKGAKYQRSWKHKYDVTIQLDELSLNVPVKIRTGSDRAWDFSKEGKSRRIGNNIIEGTNVKNGVNGDFYFCLSYIRKQAGLLFGRNFAKYPPTKRNPLQIQYLTKHELRCIEALLGKGLLKD